jgi:predicted Ser/Thr protein kinase
MDESLQTALRSVLQDDERRSAALLSSGYQGSAYRVRYNDATYVVKEAGGGFFTGWFHRLMLRREGRVYQQLADVAGVPHSPGLLDDRWLVLEFIDGSSLKEKRKQLRDREAVFTRLREVISDFHAAGVGHGDLKRKDNILLNRAEEPFVIDFGTAVMRDGNWLDRLLFPLFVRFDRNAWVKAKYRFDLDKLTEEDRPWHQPTFVENAFRQVRRFWRTITFRQARNRWKKRRAARQSDQ